MADSGDWQTLTRRRFSRRTVLKGAGKAGVGAAGLALVGCGGDDDEPAAEVVALREEVATLEEDLERARAVLFVERELRAEPDEEPEEPAEAPAAPPPLRDPLERYPRLRIAALSDVREGQAISFDYPLQGQRSVLIKLGRPAAGGVGADGDIVAFSELCTHMGCPMGTLYKAEHGILGPCACHFTTFDLTHRGMVVIGQATENLPQVVLEIEGGEVYATGMDGIIYGFRDNLADAPRAEEA